MPEIKKNNLLQRFDNISPVPLRAIGWMAVAFLASLVFNDGSVAIAYILSISTLLFDALSIVFTWRFFVSGRAKTYLPKAIISFAGFCITNILCLEHLGWRLTSAFFLIAALFVGLFYLYRRLASRT
jgi:hypothetical protein